MADLPFDFDPMTVPLTNWDDPSPEQIVNLSRRIQILEYRIELLAQQVADFLPPQGS